MTAKEMAKDAQVFCKRTWWVFLIGGIASVAFGVLAFINPGVALLVLAIYFAAFVLVDGAANIWGAISHRDKDGWWLLLLLGIAGVLVGGFALLYPPVRMAAFVYMVAFVAIFLGVSTFMLGWRVRQATSKEWILYSIGVLSALFGLFVFMRPAAGALSVVSIIATWAIVIGALRIFFALKIKNVATGAAERVDHAIESGPD
jgi:uncharacterized membrane protein HdeD (DUF308 family)